MGFLSRLRRGWTRLMADDAPTVPAKEEPRRISYDSWNVASLPAKAAVETWQLARPFPGVLPKGASTLAMDSGIQGAFEYAANSFLSEGLGFPGFAYLAELTQRAEYRRPSEIIAKEMTREWMTLRTSGDDDKADKIAAIEAELTRLDAQAIFRKAAEQDGFFGRAQIYLDTGDTDNPDELKTPLVSDRPGKVGSGKLKALRVIEPMWTYPNQYNSNNPLKAEFFKPETWFVMGTEIHSSRLMTIISRPLPDLLKPAYAFAGLSLSQMAKPYVDNWLRTRQSVSDGISNFSIMVLLADLNAMMMTGGDELIRRAELFNKCRDNRGLMIANKETEDLKNVSMPLSGLDKLQAQSQEHMSAVTGIPLVKLFGIAPSGLNASSEGEIQCFETWIGSLQEANFSPMMSRLLDIVQLSLFGEIDPEITHKWEPLRALSELDLANARKIEADTDCEYIDHGVLSPHEVRTTIAADEDSRYTIDVDDDPPMPDPAGEDMTGENDDEMVA